MMSLLIYMDDRDPAKDYKISICRLSAKYVA